MIDVCLLRSYVENFKNSGPQWDGRSCLIVSSHGTIPAERSLTQPIVDHLRSWRCVRVIGRTRSIQVCRVLASSTSLLPGFPAKSGHAIPRKFNFDRAMYLPDRSLSLLDKSNYRWLEILCPRLKPMLSVAQVEQSTSRERKPYGGSAQGNDCRCSRPKKI